MASPNQKLKARLSNSIVAPKPLCADQCAVRMQKIKSQEIIAINESLIQCSVTMLIINYHS